MAEVEITLYEVHFRCALVDFPVIISRWLSRLFLFNQLSFTHLLIFKQLFHGQKSLQKGK